MDDTESHFCAYCGAIATYQFKNGKWCCQEKHYLCPGFKYRLSEKAKEVRQRFREQYGSALVPKGRILVKKTKQYPSKGEHVCVYCGCNANYQLRDGRWCCQKTWQKCPKMKKNGFFSKGHAPWNKGKSSWNKGLTKETDLRVAKSAAKLRNSLQTGRVIHFGLGKHLSKEHKLKISKALKTAQKEGRAHNIGQCRWEHKHSYPEEWLIGVIANEFNDKQYICEMPFYRFALDFAWVHKKKCIEVDGGWHERSDQQERDRCKDDLLQKEGWQVFRMPWKEVLKDKQGWIAKAKRFIDE